jgi:hypothetical protein
MATRPPDWFHATAFVLCVDESTPITNLSVALVIRNPRSVAAALADDRPGDLDTLPTPVRRPPCSTFRQSDDKFAPFVKRVCVVLYLLLVSEKLELHYPKEGRLGGGEFN